MPGLLSMHSTYRYFTSIPAASSEHCYGVVTQKLQLAFTMWNGLTGLTGRPVYRTVHCSSWWFRTDHCDHWRAMYPDFDPYQLSYLLNSIIFYTVLSDLAKPLSDSVKFGPNGAYVGVAYVIFVYIFAIGAKQSLIHLTDSTTENSEFCDTPTRSLNKIFEVSWGFCSSAWGGGEPMNALLFGRQQRSLSVRVPS
jgi:hypothetical protein